MAGGGGSRYAFANLAVQLSALSALAIVPRAGLDFAKCAPLPLALLILASMALPVLYLVPLPQAAWSAAPGRELVAASFELVDRSWAPLSVDPVRTALAVTALVTPFAALAIGLACSRDRLVLAGWVVVACALTSIVLGIPQTLFDGQDWLLYPENLMPNVLFGAFANRNSTGLFLVSALALAAFLPVPRRLAQIAQIGRLALLLLLLAGIVLTRSRTALVLALLPIGMFALHAIRASAAARKGGPTGKRETMRGWLVPATLIGAILVAGLIIIAAPGRVADTIERFNTQGTGPRAYIWEDALYSAQRYWPIGAGTGTFDELFQVDESLENLAQRRAGRAHNDWLELAIELGAPGLSLAAAWLCVLAWLAWRARRSHGRWIAWSGALILLGIALQSITDYPLRNQTMLAVAGFGLAVLVRFGEPSRRQRQRA
ncbi:MAG: O-antigen ligase family protein [Erythrobacter sp.]|nr:O-antigen ligase family protein [Erythrobacter sp.]